MACNDEDNEVTLANILGALTSIHSLFWFVLAYKLATRDYMSDTIFPLGQTIM